MGYTYCDKEDLKGGDAQENAQITKDILYGIQKGAKRQAVCFNAGAALYIANKAQSIKEGVRMAENLIDEGMASKQLERFIVESNK